MPQNYDSNLYYCCCNRIHVRFATCVIAVLELIVICILLLFSTVAYTNNYLMALPYSLIIFVIFIQFLSSITTLYAVREANPTLLLITFVIRFIYELATLFYFILILIAMAMKGEFAREVFGQPFNEKDVYFFTKLNRWQLIMITGSTLMAIILQAWFLDVIKKCYIYLRDRVKFSEAINAAEAIGPLWSDG